MCWPSKAADQRCAKLSLGGLQLVNKQVLQAIGSLRLKRRK
jgi:hypothetical protein